MASKLFRDLRDTEINHTGKVAYQGDPIGAYTVTNNKILLLKKYNQK
jgi:hypothetical protein